MAERVAAIPDHLTALADHARHREPTLVVWLRSAAASLGWHDRATVPPHRLQLTSLLEEVELLVARFGALDRWADDVGDAIARADGDGSDRHGRASAPTGAVVVGPIRSVHPRDARVAGASLPTARVTYDHLPPDERDRRLRALVRDHLVQLPALGPDADAEAWAERALLGRLADGGLTHTDDGHRVRLLSFRGAVEGDSALQVAVGDLDRADATLVWIPGTTHGVDDLELELTYADRLRGFAATDEARDLAIVVDLYDGPDTITPEAGQERWGQRHAPDLRAVTAEVATRGRGPVTLVGHSYGTFAIGAAADDEQTLLADAVVLLAPPGASVRHASDLNLADDARVWAARAPQDPIWVAADADRLLGLPNVGRVGLGPDPVDVEFGAEIFMVNHPDTPSQDWVRGHSQDAYLSADSASFRNVVAVAVGKEPTLPDTADLATRHDAVGWPAWGPDQWYLGSDGSRATPRGVDRPGENT